MSSLTQNEMELISQIVMDEETGDDLLNIRNNEYISFRHTLYVMMASNPTNNHDIELCDYYWACHSPELMEKYNNIYNN